MEDLSQWVLKRVFHFIVYFLPLVESFATKKKKKSLSRIHVCKPVSSFSPLSIFSSWERSSLIIIQNSFFFSMTFLSVLNCFGSCLCLRTWADVYTESREGGMTWRFKDYIWNKGGRRGEMPLTNREENFALPFSTRCRQTISIHVGIFHFNCF